MTSTIDQFTPNTRVAHPVFGLGVVVEPIHETLEPATFLSGENVAVKFHLRPDIAPWHAPDAPVAVAKCRLVSMDHLCA